MSLNAGHGQESHKEGERARLYPAPVSRYSNGRGGGPDSAPNVEQSLASAAPLDDNDEVMASDATDVSKAAAFGAMDGVLLGFSIVAGAAGGGFSPRSVLVVGVAIVAAEALSMGLGEYLSSKAMNEYIFLQRKREEWELDQNRETGVANMIELYVKAGMTREDAEEVSTRLSKYQNCFVNAMLARDIGTYGAPLDDGASVREGLASFVSYAVSGFIPFLIYALSPVIAYLGGGESASDGMQFFLACLVTTVALIVLAIVKAKFVSRSVFNSVLETLFLGGCSAGVAYEIGAAMASLVQDM
ncbi:unnamed protein product [Ascophyllum nodosum]